MRILYAALCGFALDLLLGDPERLAFLHPVVWMGKAITTLEGFLRPRFPQDERGAFRAGLVMALLLSLGTLILCKLILHLLNMLCPPLAFALEVIWCWQALAVKDLRVEALRVQRALESGTLADARRAVSRIVGRDTGALDAAGVTRAAVETVAENFSDGVVSPLLYMLLGGAPLALCCKAINTMDSMVGYKNERYLYFGRAAARLDDAANYLPARFAALLLCAAAKLCGEDAAEALRIWRRDRRNHPSPNSAQCEAAMAGALRLRLSGPASYFGVLHGDKPYIGDDLRPIEPTDITRACRMELVGSLLALTLFSLVRLVFVI
ncbi:MAG: adenosylcobinamide-phosphate synthase CbiB [Oscillospiraceae bacterium]|nr:adenosylcobinamide-phosphate synthase CbiB [Oscillospiraceae bacterium]